MPITAPSCYAHSGAKHPFHYPEHLTLFYLIYSDVSYNDRFFKLSPIYSIMFDVDFRTSVMLKYLQSRNVRQSRMLRK